MNLNNIKNRINSNTKTQTLLYTSSRAFAKFFGTLAILLFARNTDPKQYGIYFLILSVVYIFFSFSDLGLLQNLIRKSKGKNFAVFLSNFFNFLIVNLVFSIFLFLTLLYYTNDTLVAILSAIYFLSLKIQDYLYKLHFVLDDIFYVSISTILEKFTLFLLVFFFKVNLLRLLFYLIFTVLLSDLILYLVLLLKGHNFSLEIKLKPDLMLDLISLEFFLAGIFMVLASRFPNLIYKMKFGTTSLGIYGLALTLYQAIAFVLTQAGQFLNVKGGRFQRKQLLKFRKYTLIFSSVLLMFALFLWIFRFNFVNYLISSKFSDSNTIFFILMLSLATQPINIYVTTILLHKSPKDLMKTNLVYFILSIFFALIAKNIFVATIYRVVVQYLYLLFGFYLTFKYV